MQSELKQPSLASAVVLAAALVAIDAFLLNQGVIAALVGVWMLFVALPRAAFGEPAVRRARLMRVAVFLAAALLVFGLNWINNTIARTRAETLIDAISAFKQTNQRYPRDLGELVPGFLDRVPNAKYTFGHAAFDYIAADENAALMYVAFPPFYRPTYQFKSGRWEILD
jgi:hypothetical protein